MSMPIAFVVLIYSPTNPLTADEEQLVREDARRTINRDVNESVRIATLRIRPAEDEKLRDRIAEMRLLARALIRKKPKAIYVHADRDEFSIETKEALFHYLQHEPDATMKEQKE